MRIGTALASALVFAIIVIISRPTTPVMQIPPFMQTVKSALEQSRNNGYRLPPFDIDRFCKNYTRYGYDYDTEAYCWTHNQNRYYALTTDTFLTWSKQPLEIRKACIDRNPPPYNYGDLALCVSEEVKRRVAPFPYEFFYK
jgi:hypothetical protein